jgi:uncharacterized protein YlxW (UPF0749 family)
MKKYFYIGSTILATCLFTTSAMADKAGDQARIADLQEQVTLLTQIQKEFQSMGVKVDDTIAQIAKLQKDIDDIKKATSEAASAAAYADAYNNLDNYKPALPAGRVWGAGVTLAFEADEASPDPVVNIPEATLRKRDKVKGFFKKLVGKT